MKVMFYSILGGLQLFGAMASCSYPLDCQQTSVQATSADVVIDGDSNIELHLLEKEGTGSLLRVDDAGSVSCQSVASGPKSDEQRRVLSSLCLGAGRARVVGFGEEVMSSGKWIPGGLLSPKKCLSPADAWTEIGMVVESILVSQDMTCEQGRAWLRSRAQAPIVDMYGNCPFLVCCVQGAMLCSAGPDGTPYSGDEMCWGFGRKEVRARRMH